MNFFKLNIPIENGKHVLLEQSCNKHIKSIQFSNDTGLREFITERNSVH